MSLLSSSSTLAEIEAACLDNISFKEDNSTSKASAFITACKMLLMKRPASMAAGGGVTFGSQADVKSMLDDAEQWLSQQSQGGSVRHLDFGSCRT